MRKNLLQTWMDSAFLLSFLDAKWSSYLHILETHVDPVDWMILKPLMEKCVLGAHDSSKVLFWSLSTPTLSKELLDDSTWVSRSISSNSNAVAGVLPFTSPVHALPPVFYPHLRAPLPSTSLSEETTTEQDKASSSKGLKLSYSSSSSWFKSLFVS